MWFTGRGMEPVHILTGRGVLVYTHGTGIKTRGMVATPQLGGAAGNGELGHPPELFRRVACGLLASCCAPSYRAVVPGWYYEYLLAGTSCTACY